MEKKKRSFWERLRKKYKVVAHNQITYEEKWSVSVSPLNVISLVGIFSILIGFITYLLLAHSPFKFLLPFQDDREYREQAIENSLRMDSLQRKIHQYDVYVEDLKKVILGEEFYNSYNQSKRDSTQSITGYENVNFVKSPQDSLLRVKVENNQQQSKESFSGGQKLISGLLFYSPIRGRVSQSFNASSEHFGVDVVANKDTPIKGTLDGVVIFSGWTPEDGNTIMIAHEASFISVYKHNSSLLKKSGDRIEAGDAIAIIGNTGKHTTGTHLHFELWQNQKPVNPEDYISFQ